MKYNNSVILMKYNNSVILMKYNNLISVLRVQLCAIICIVEIFSNQMQIIARIVKIYTFFYFAC